MRMRYCIGCVSCIFKTGIEGYCLSELTWENDETAELFCDRKHWRVEFNQTTREQFQAMMETADTCEDFVERAPPPLPPDPRDQQIVDLRNALATAGQVIQGQRFEIEECLKGKR